MRRRTDPAVKVAPPKSQEVQPESSASDLKAATFSLGSRSSASAERLIAHAIKFKLLSPQEEQDLARERVEADRAISLLQRSLAEANCRGKSELSTKLQRDLDKECERRDGVVNTFIERNIRLAIKIAGDYAFLPTELEMRIASALDGLPCVLSRRRQNFPPMRVGG